MKPLNWTLGLLICLAWPAIIVRAQDSIKEPARSAPALALTAYVRPALIAQIYDSQGHLENSATSLGGALESVLTFDGRSDYDLTLKTPEGYLYLRRIEIEMSFAGFESEMGRIYVSAIGPPQSASTTLVEGPAPESVLPVNPNERKLLSDAIRSGNRFIRYVGFFVPTPLDLSGFKPMQCQLRYDVAVPQP